MPKKRTFINRWINSPRARKGGLRTIGSSKPGGRNISGHSAGKYRRGKKR